MSGKGDSGDLSKGEELSAVNITATDTDENASKNVTASSTLRKNEDDLNSPLTSTSRADKGMDDDIEAIIEKKLNFDKVKAFDIDSESDFELKWDDDSEINSLNDDESVKETGATDRNPLTAIQADSTSNDEISKDIETPPSTATKDTMLDDNIFKIDTSIKIDFTSKLDSDTNSSDEHLVYSDVDSPEINPPKTSNQVDSTFNDEKSKNSETPLSTVNQAKTLDDDIFKVDTSIKVDFTSKLDSDNSSSDEHLVYSDDAPEIEDKELLDELDAHISQTDKTDDSMEETNPIVPEVLREKTGDDICQQDLNSNEMDIDDKIIEEVEKPALKDTVSTVADTDASTCNDNAEHKLGNLDTMIEIPTQELIEDFDDSGEFEGAEQYDEDLLLQNDPEFTEPEVSNNPVKDIDNPATNEQAIPEELSIKEVFSIAETTSDLEDKLLADTVEESAIATAEKIDTEAELISDNEPQLAEDNTIDQDIEMIDKANHADIILEASHQESEVLIEATEPSENIEASIINVETKVDTEVDKSSSIVDTAAHDSMLHEEATGFSNVDNIESLISESKEILKQKTNPNEFTETKEMASKVDMEANEVISTELTEEVSEPKIAVVDDFIDNAQLSSNPDDFQNAQPSSNLDDFQQNEEETMNVNILSVQSLPKELGDSIVDDFTNTQPSSSKPDDLQLKEIGFLDTAESLQKDLGDAKIDDFTSTQPSTSEDLQPKKSELTELDIDLVQPSTSKSNETQLKETETKNVDIAQPSTSKTDDLQPKEIETKNFDTDIHQPSISKTEDLPQKEVETKNIDTDIPQPSTSKADDRPLKEINTEQSNMMQELSDEDQETDTLGLLAESSRVMDDDDEQEQDQEQDDEDDDDDFDPDEESNQMTAEHSEDSNAPHSETEPRGSAAAAPTEPDQPSTGLLEAASPDVETETAVDDSIEVTASEVEMAVKALISSNVEEESTDVPALSDTDVKLSSEDSNSSSKLRELLSKKKDGVTESEVKSPSKVKKLEISKQKFEYNIVELEESSSEDDVQVVNKPEQAEPTSVTSVTTVTLPSDIEVIAAGGELSKLTEKEGEVTISVPKPPPHKPARLNTGEVTIKTGVTTVVQPMLIPETAVSLQDAKPKAKYKAGLEIFNLDSDDEDKDKESKKAVDELKCINVYCASDGTVPRTSADAAAAAYYGGARRGALCTPCADAVQQRTLSLIEGVKNFTPLLSLPMGQIREELVEISDSESEEEIEIYTTPEDAVGDATAKFLEENLADVFNATWLKYNMDERLQEAQKQIDIEVRQLEEDCKDIDTMLSECQVATDKLRRDLYDTFAHERKELPAILIIDTPTNAWSGLEEGILAYEKPELPTRQSKRRLQASSEPPAKKPAIPLGYTPLDSDKKTQDTKPTVTTTNIPIQNEDDNADISVVKLSAESAPAGLPPAGMPRRPPLRPQMAVYAMRNAFGAWIKAKIQDVLPRHTNASFTMCRVKFEHKVKNPCKVLPARCLAYEMPAEVRMTIGTRVIALFADTQSNNKSYYSGIIAEIPNPVNNYRYLVFFDDGYAQYVQHQHTRLVCECAPLVWDEVHPFSRQFVRDYLRAYPERPMVRAHAGQSLKTEWNGKWWVSKVIQVDASLVQVHFEEDNRTEWIYRGSTRLAPLYLELQAAERQRARPLPRAAPGRKVNMPYVEYTRTDDPAPAPTPLATPTQNEELRRQRAVAKKSTTLPQPPPAAPIDGVSSRVVFYTPKNAIKPLKMVPHTCSPRCRRTDVLPLKDLRTYNPLSKPLLSGWERQIVKYRFTKSVMYRAPCGRRVRDNRELHRYLQSIGSEMGVDLFDFGVGTHCLAEFVLNKCLVSKKDLSHGKENVPVPCVNYYDSSLPEFCSYNTERTPTAGVPLNLDPEFLCGCDCTDDCADKSKCACWKMTLEGARTIGLDTSDVGYVYKRLPEPLPSGIYECNVRCKCRQTCLNRVAQHPLQLKLQVFKTLNRGWGIRALNDVPKGAFLCVYAGNLLTDATANLDGLNEGDEYLAELDYIEVVEQMKEGFEEDIPEADKKLDQEEDSSSLSSSSSEEERAPRQDTYDADFRPDKILLRSQVTEYSKRLRKREKTKKRERENKEKQKDKDGNGDDCITISDDEELREPSRFAAQAGMGGKEFVSKYKSVRAHFGKDEACYIMDAKVQGNIGRYLNHSCTPNVFVQNVFVDTHDPRFPWVAFFALTHIRAGTELTWNYNYDVGSVPGKVLYCHCAAPNCRGRLL